MIWDYTDDSMCTLLPLWKDMNLSTAKHNAKRERENILPSFTLRKNRLPWDKMTPSSYRYDCSSLLCRLTTVSYARISYQCECVLLHFFFFENPNSGGVLAMVTTNNCKPLLQGRRQEN